MKRIIIVVSLLSLNGCALTNHCDSRSIRLEYEHVSHPFAGPPFGPVNEEEWLDHAGPVGRCQVGKGYVEGTLGYKLNDGGLDGPKITGGIRVGVELWSR